MAHDQEPDGMSHAISSLVPFDPHEPVGELEWVDVFTCQVCLKDCEFLHIDGSEPGEPSDWVPFGWFHREETDHRVVPPPELADWGNAHPGSK